ncbi:MAG: hypothetical protein RL759_783, partial [Verrucomicrobiota bacterium]
GGEFFCKNIPLGEGTGGAPEEGEKGDQVSHNTIFCLKSGFWRAESVPACLCL